MFQINTEFLINQLKNCFYAKQLTPLLHLEKKFALSIAQVFENIHFFTTFLQFVLTDKVCNVSEKYQPRCNLANY